MTPQQQVLKKIRSKKTTTEPMLDSATVERLVVAERERLEVAERLVTVERLKAWAAEGYPNDPSDNQGRPRQYFGLKREAWNILVKSYHLQKPTLNAGGLSWGFAFDGLEAWRFCVRLAYAKGYFWVCLQSGKRLTRKNPPFRTLTFPCPIHQKDVLRVVTTFIPKETGLELDDFKWAEPLRAEPEFGMPWVTPRKYGWTGERLMTFFGLDPVRERIRVGSTAAPAQRCGNEELQLLGICDLDKEIVRTKLASYATDHVGWFKVNDKSFKAIAEMCSKYAKEELLK